MAYCDEAPELTDDNPVILQQSRSLHIPSEEEGPANIDEAFAAILIHGTRHHAPLVYQEEMYDMFNKLYKKLGQRAGKSFDRKKKLFRKELPSTTVTYVVEDKKTHMAHRIQETAFRRSLFPATNYRRLFTETRVNLRQQLLFHAKLHKGDMRHQLESAVKNKHDIPIKLYIDGIQPSKSGKSKVIVECFRLKCCKQMMNLAIIEYDRELELYADDLLLGLIEEFTALPNVKVELLVADLPERCRLAGKISFNGEHGCIHCTTSGMPREGGGGIVYPSWTMDADLRDDLSYKNFSDTAVESKQVIMGVKERSLLFELQGFSITHNLALDPMHLFSGLISYYYSNLTKKLMTPNTAASFKEDLDEYYANLIVPTDFKRDTRNIDFTHFKWTEWKQLLLIGGMEMARGFESRGHVMAGQIWRIMMFVLRAMAMGDEWYNHASVGGSLVVALIAKLYTDIEEVLGTEHCTANLHNLTHLPMWRERYVVCNIFLLVQ